MKPGDLGKLLRATFKPVAASPEFKRRLYGQLLRKMRGYSPLVPKRV